MRQKTVLLNLVLLLLGTTPGQAATGFGEAVTPASGSGDDHLDGGSTRLSGVEGFEIRWWTADGGGGLNSSGGDFSLSVTIGQPEASGAMNGGQFSMTPGFWAPITGEPCGIFCDGFESGNTLAWSSSQS